MVLTLRVFGKTINQFELLEFINRDDENRAEFTPPASENKKLKVLLETLGRIQSESRQLQSDDVMLWEVRFCIERPRINSTYYGDYLDTRGTIVASPDYESACVRIQLEKAASSESPREEG
ncbi:hypothetical protein L917_19990, partial [Phytophthora nicotianae]